MQHGGASRRGREPLIKPGGSAKPRLKERHVKRNKHSILSDDPLWYKDAIIYQIHIKSFFDANNDGIGDFPGLLAKLDYIEELGVDCIWLLPFYPSPRRDDGYDIADYRNVHPDYGTLADVKRFIQEAHARGIRVVTELVINHTSDQHPWFQRARLAKPGSNHRNYYVWSDTDKKYEDTRIIFIDSEPSNWTHDPVAGQYYWHRFFNHQPDLNFDNPAVLKEVLSVMRFWLDMGIDGLRLDAVPYLVEREGTNNENLPETHAILKKIRATIDAEYPNRMLLAEANQWPEDVKEYFGDEDECHMAFHFPLMPRIYMSIASEDRFPITDIMRQTPDLAETNQWAIFLRNHDELTLEMVTDSERDYLWNTYASDRRARLNLGIRRRLAPLMERDRRRIELINSLLLSMPGTPVIYYGDELGMGDNIHLGDRDGVRTPMQWSLDRNGGFSRCDPAALVLPPVMDSLYGFQAVNVEAQARDAHSLLNWMRRMLSIRKQQQAFGRGTLRLLYPTNRRVLAYLREYAGPDGSGAETILCIANVSRAAQAVELELAEFSGRVPVEMLGGAAFPPIGQLPYLLTLPPYGFFWFVLAPLSRMPTWFVPAPQPLPEFVTLVLRNSLEELLAEPIRGILEKEVLPAYLPKRRWFAGKDQVLEQTRIVEISAVPGIEPPVLLAAIEAQMPRGTDRYLLPFGFIAEDA